MTQDDKVAHDEEENKKFIEHPFHSLQPPAFLKDNSPVLVTHENSQIASSLDTQSEESYELSNFLLKW